MARSSKWLATVCPCSGHHALFTNRPNYFGVSSPVAWWRVGSSPGSGRALSAKRSKRLERISNVGAQRPTKMPKRSACARVSTVLRSKNHQMAIERRIDAIPAKRQMVDIVRHMAEFIAARVDPKSGTQAIPQLAGCAPRLPSPQTDRTMKTGAGGAERHHAAQVIDRAESRNGRLLKANRRRAHGQDLRRMGT